MGLKLSKPFIRRKQLDSVLQVLIDDSDTAFQATKDFITRVTKTLDVEAGLTFSSSFVGLLTLFQSLDLVPGDAVVTSPLSSPQFQEAALQYGLTLLFADVEAKTPLLSIQSVEDLLDQEPRLIFIDSTLGYVADFESFKAFNIPIIEDFSYSLGGFRDSNQAGKGGDFSLYLFQTDTVLTPGGGMILLANGKKNGAILKNLQEVVPHYHWLPELMSALALSQWEVREKIHEKKREIYKHLFHQIRSLSIDYPRQPGKAEALGSYYPVLIHGSVTDALNYAQKKGVPCKRAFEYVKTSLWDDDPSFCPNARNFVLKTLLFPLHPSLTNDNLSLLCKVISSLP